MRPRPALRLLSVLLLAPAHSPAGVSPPAAGRGTIGEIQRANPGREGGIVHSCIYVADDIVFTRNGYSYQMPWTLATMRDMLAAYPEDSALEVHAFRRKG